MKIHSKITALSIIIFIGFSAVAAIGKKDTIDAVEASILQNERFASYLNSRPAKLARQNWMLNCQGCHKADGSGRPDKGMPDMRGIVASYLNVKGGRAYLGRVPGVVNAALNDQDLAELLEWTLITFDPQNIPEDHQPFSAEEIKCYRAAPLALRASAIRETLIDKINPNN